MVPGPAPTPVPGPVPGFPIPVPPAAGVQGFESVPLFRVVGLVGVAAPRGVSAAVDPVTVPVVPTAGEPDVAPFAFCAGVEPG